METRAVEKIIGLNKKGMEPIISKAEAEAQH